LAQTIDQTMKGLPAECRELGFRRVAALPQAIEIKDGERADISLITSDAVDRDLEVMMPQGGDWKAFQKNPVVTFAHRYDELPVGRALWVKRHSDEHTNGWIAKTQYTTKPPDWQGAWFPDAVWHMVKTGDLRGKSIGFLPLEISPPEEKEITARPELAKVARVIRKWTALEYAVAPVQSNPDAMVIAVGKAESLGIVIPEAILEEAGIYVPLNLPKLTYDQHDEFEPFTKPYPNEHSARVRDPGDFIDESFRRKKIDTGVSLIMGKLKGGDGAMVAQAYRFSVDNFTVAEAKAWCKKHDVKYILFEPASGERESITLADVERELHNIDVKSIVCDTLDQMRGRV